MQHQDSEGLSEEWHAGLWIKCICELNIADPVCLDRYHCYHSAGVHTVALPWQGRFRQFCNDSQCFDATTQSVCDSIYECCFSEVEAAEDLVNVEGEEQAIVEHLVCTRPLTNRFPSRTCVTTPLACFC